VTDNLVILSSGAGQAGFAGNEVPIPGYPDWLQPGIFPKWGFRSQVLCLTKMIKVLTLSDFV
jgi:hypothetical protein